MDNFFAKGMQEWKESYVIVCLLVKMFKISMKTQIVSHIILFQGNF
jgi:hypothetical protein